MGKEKDEGDQSERARAKQRGAKGRKSSRQLDGLPGSTFYSSNEKITKDVSLEWVSGICRASPLSISLSPWNSFSFDFQRQSMKTSNLYRSCPEAYYRILSLRERNRLV